jgi:hypothetical protein
MGINILDLGQRVEDAVIVDGVLQLINRIKLILMKVLKVSLLRTHLFR